MNSANSKVSVSVVKSIISDYTQFLKFINKKGEFKNVNIKFLLDAINSYTRYLIKTCKSLSKDFFKKVNYINNLFQTNINYDYEDYLKKEKTIISSAMIDSILNDKQVLEKFMDFDNYEDFFQNIPIEKYLKAIYNMMCYYEKNNLCCLDIERKSFEQIMCKYSLLLKKNYVLKGPKIKENVDKEFKNYILENVNYYDDKFTIARSIYLNLCKALSYDINYFAFKKNFDNETIQKLFNKPISEINLQKNRVVCHTWSLIYTSLLNEIGIDAAISNNTQSIHKSTLLNADGTIIRADATELILDQNKFMLCDLARVQMGLGTAGFTCQEKYKNIDLDIKKADFKCQYQELTKMEFINQIKIEKNKIEMLYNLCQNNTMQDFELMIYIKLIIKLLIDNMFAWHVGIKESTYNFNPYLLINYYNSYYLLCKNNIEPINFEKVKKLYSNGNLSILNSKSMIPGLNCKVLRK